MTPQLILLGTLAHDKSALQTLITQAGFGVTLAEDVEQALNVASGNAAEMIFADSRIDLPALFEGLRAAKLTAKVVVIGPSQPAAHAAKAIRLGAIEYLSTPANEGMVLNLLENVKPAPVEGIIAGDPKTFALIEQAKRFANANATVLLRGESGVGKEVFCKFIHANSPRAKKSFISVNCAAIPENLLESELFGHEKGAFSGALNSKPGKFKLADGGTLLLDEISEMDLGLQAKLLRAIQERVIDPVGASSPVPVDIRLIATTNRALEKEVEAGTFREDLYFRLNVVMLELLPLRERPGDIGPLAEHFAKQYGTQNGLKNITLSQGARDKLTHCYWKGNVRELENTIHRAVLMMGHETVMQETHIVISPMSLNRANDVPQPHATTSTAPTQARTAAAANAYASAGGMFEKGTGANRPATRMVGHTMEEVERDLILSTLDYCGGDRSYAADILGISLKVLRDKLMKYQSEEAPLQKSAAETTPLSNK